MAAIEVNTPLKPRRLEWADCDDEPVYGTCYSLEDAASIIQSKWCHYRLRRRLKDNPWHQVPAKGKKKSTHASHKKAAERAAQKARKHDYAVNFTNAFKQLSMLRPDSPPRTRVQVVVGRRSAVA